MYVSRARRARARLRALLVVALGIIVLMPKVEMAEPRQFTGFSMQSAWGGTYG